MAPSPNPLITSNGIDGSTGRYLTPPLSAAQLCRIVCGDIIDASHLSELKWRADQENTQHYALKEGVNPLNLSETGWGVIFAADAEPAVREALSPLLNLRRSQASAVRENGYREFTGVDGYRPDESKLGFLSRHGAGPGPVDPERVPYYLLIVGDPETIPYRFQYQLDVQYAVGRIHFDSLDEYARYAESVVLAETGGVALARRAAIWATANTGDAATQLSLTDLARPLSETITTVSGDWSVKTALGDGATKAQLANLLRRDTPALLFTASHGLGFPKGDPKQFAHQGALVCQDWPGPESNQPLSQDSYFSAEDVADDANLLGLIAMHFACFGGGTPLHEEYSEVGARQRASIAPKAFVSRLPQRLLAHPKGGALAVIAHVGRSWGYSFRWDRAGRQLQTFESTLRRLMEGHPVGSALEYFNGRYAELASDLSVELEEIKWGKVPDEYSLCGMWTANNDARAYAVIGDPAVRLQLSKNTEEERRPIMEQITIKNGSSPDQARMVAPPAPPPEAVPYGLLDSFKEGQTNLSLSLQHVVERLGAALANAFESLTTVEVSTYVSDNLKDVKFEQGKFTGANLRALTRASLDGNTLVCVPEQDGKVDTELWKVHSEIVEKALANRNEMFKLAASAAASIASGLKLT